jgi:nitroreductase
MAGMDVTEAILTRRTCRAFLDKPIPKETIVEILEKAKRAPSGGNLQPWHVYVVTGKVKEEIIKGVHEALPESMGAQYNVYPPDLIEPYRSRRHEIGELLYGLINVPREDKETRRQWFARNYEFFGAPVGMFFTIDETMEQGQWADLGMFLQTIMLLAREYGLHTAPQESWAAWTPLVRRVLKIPENEMLFCGLSLGYEDPEHPLAKLQSPRVPLNEYATFYGFN